MQRKVHHGTAWHTSRGRGGPLLRTPGLPAALLAVIVLGCGIRLVATSRLSYSAFVELSLPLITRMLFLLYPLVSNVAFEAFSCYEFDNGKRAVLVSDVRITCSTPWAGSTHNAEHTRITNVAFVAIGVYPVGLLVLSTASSSWRRARRSSPARPPP